MQWKIGRTTLIKIGNDPVSYYKKFCYLGSMVDLNGGPNLDITNRIGVGVQNVDKFVEFFVIRESYSV